MTPNRPLGILCVSSYEKGHEFLRTAKRLGCVVYLLTTEKLRNASWPHDSIDESFFMPMPEACERGLRSQGEGTQLMNSRKSS